MNKITHPLNRRSPGPQVADLHDALQVLLDRALILANDEGARREAAAALRRDLPRQSYGEATANLVSIFQRERHLQPSGEVDGPTADAFNKLLRELGLLNQERPPAFRLVTGVVRREDGVPLQSARVRASHVAERREIRLGDDTADEEGRYTIRHDALPGVDAINLKVSAIGEDGRTIAASALVPNAKPVETIDLTVPIAAPAADRQTIEGAILLEHGQPAEKLKLRLYRRDFGGKATLLDETTTVGDGRYAFSFDAKSRAASLEVRAVKPDGEEVPLSKPLNDLTAENRARLNLLAPRRLQPLAAEYRRLSADLTPHVADMKKLKDAKEDAQQQDLSVLNRATGWDARLIALASVTERLAADPDVGLPSEALYGLLRAGLPSDKLLLAQVEPDVVEMAIKKVREAGVVDIDDAGIAALKTQFTAFANKTRLAMPVPGSRSTYGDLLKSAGLPQAAQDKFAPVYLKHRGDGTQLWEEARKAGLDGKEVRTLQLQGKLAFLAGNSEAMTTRMLGRGLKDPSELAGQDFHSAAAWKTEVFEQAGVPQARRANPTDADRKKLEAVIPAIYGGEKVEARLDAYAEDMARKVRLSYPTQVLGRLMETDPHFKLPTGHDATIKLLKNATAQGFRLGDTPVSSFLQSRPGVRDGLTEAEFRDAGEQMKVMQRVYQITPSNEAMPVLMSLGMTSAFDVMAYPDEQFIALFNAKYLEIYKTPAPAGVPELVSRKAKQVSSVTYNLFAIAKKLDSEPPVAGISAPLQVRESVKNELIKHFPTMESLFGSMDYCECEHCRSVLSPAAYLVDLLQFVDAEPAVWGNFLAHWKETHGSQEYPHKNAAGDGMKPYDVLVERRPDLPHIALTCENTHTALPYIDIVNEILEYYVANGKLAKEAARDTGDATTAELLAEPQNVIREAYDTLRSARYPLNLPFDLWLETVRKFCDYFETPLHRVLEVLRPDEDLFAPIQNPTNIGNAMVSVGNADAAKLSNGMSCTYLIASTNALSGESKRISTVGAADSGGAGQTTITFVGTWTSAPVAGDRLVSRPLDHRAAIFMESLGLAPAEVDILADPNPLPKWHELYGFATAADATTEATDAATGQRVDLNSAKALSRRLSVTYKEIAEIVQTGFVNPEFSKLGLLYKLDVSVRDAKLYKDEKAFYEANQDLLGVDRSTLSAADQQRFDDLAKKRPNSEFTGWQVLSEVAAFEHRLADLATAFEPPLNVVDLRNAIQAIPFDRVLVLADPDTGCSFDQTTLQYADGTKADAIVFLRINLFVRLWRKLGWSIEETDRALTTFVPQSTPFDGAAGNLTKQPLRTALIYLAHLKALDEKLRVGKQGRLKLLTLWSNIPTTGKKPLYAQLFLNRSVLKSSPVFDHPLGQYLIDATVKLKDHLLALQGALGLTADEIGRILADAGKALDTLELSLASVSLLYRYSQLAKAVKLPVRDLIALKQVSGLDPFKPLLPDPLVTLDQDHPFVQTLEFVKVAEEVKDSGLKIEDLDYLLRHRFDDTGKYRPNREAMLALLKSLSEGVRAIRVEHAVPDEPSALSDDVLRQKLGLALAPDVVERLLGMVNTTAEFTAIRGGVNAADKFGPEIFAAEERIRQVSYKEVPRQEQTLTVRGVLVDPAKTAMRTRFDAVLTAAQKQTFADLLDGVERQAREFFDNQLKKQTLRLDGEAGFLEDADFPKLFAPLDPLTQILSTDTQAEVDFKRAENEKIERENLEELRKRRYRIGQAFLPFLQQRMIRQFIVQTMTAHTGADPVLLESLVGDERLLAVPSALLNEFAATAERGLNATFWASADSTGAPLPAISLVDADTGAKDGAGNPLKPAGADSARLEAYVEVPIPGAYRFYIELDKQNARAELRFPHRAEPVLVKGTAAADHARLGNQPNEYLELKAGVLYRLTLDLTHLNGGDGRLLVQGESVPKGPLSQLALYPAATIEAAERATTLLSKALQMVQSLGLSEREIRYLLTHAADFDGVSLSELPTAAVGDSPAEHTSTAQRFGRFRRLAAYARLKRDLAGGTDDLLGTFEANGTAAADRLDKQIYPLIAKLTRRDEATVEASAEALVKAPAVPAFESERPLWRLWEALQVVERFGVPPAWLLGWSDMVNNATTGARRFELARDAKEAIKARFEPETWQRVAQPIFDKLRPRQRDALASHVMHQHGFDRMEQLYEYFLVDPGMEPVVQTSRIRLAIASLQLFIQRCLLNLEPKVHPSTINAKQWEWMKRYRVWEANRKIFLFPENWLEPEFRDDKTHLFTELEGALLQGDVSSDLVEDAFLSYLKKLDELARLDICAMHIEDNFDPALRVLHVLGRTYSQPHKYFYRRYAHQMWTPWEPVSAEIEGDHLAPVVWRDRLYLFWVTFADQADPNPSTGTATGSKKLTDVTLTEVMTDLKAVVAQKQVDVQLHWSVYLNGEWNTRESGDFSGVITKTVPTSFSRSSVFVHVSKEYDPADGAELGVFVHMSGAINQAFYLAGRNSAPEKEDYGAPSANPPGPLPENKFTSANVPSANRYSGNGALKVSFREWITTEPGKTPPPANPYILKTGDNYTLLPCNNHLTALGVSEDASQGAVNPGAVEAAIKSGLGEIATLMKPVFYQDSRHTFFVEPEVAERTIEEWQEWVTRTPTTEPGWTIPDWWKDIVVIPEIPRKWPIPVPDDPWRSPIHPGSLINPVPDRDWLVNPGSVINFGDVLIGPIGQPGIEIRGGAVPAIGPGRVNAGPGGDLASGSTIVVNDASSFARSGLREIAGGLNVVGGAGFNAALEKNFTDLNRSGFGAGTPGVGRMER
ncbi:MAG: neuraminidase-like domain-containing protein [Planctomycetota bacterium]